MLTPCIDCAERRQGCHATCEAYARWRISHDKIAAEQRKRYNDEAKNVLIDSAVRKRKHWARSHRR